jgi:hypothetical protein
MPVAVTVVSADVYYRPTAGTESVNHDIVDILPMLHSNPFPDSPVMDFQLSHKHMLDVKVAAWHVLSDPDFTRFKNGGKRLPSGVPADDMSKTVGAVSRDRPDREKSPVLEGDVGPYKKGDGNLYKANLTPATSTRPAHWTPNNPPQYKTDPALHVQQQQNRDHQNNQAALKSRGVNPAEGTAITIPQWIHMNGYTFGAKAKPGHPKSPANADKPGQSRTQWIAANPSAALFKEIYHTIRLYQLSGQLTYEIVGSYRYLYKLNVKNLKYDTTDDLDNLIMYYLGLAH